MCFTNINIKEFVYYSAVILHNVFVVFGVRCFTNELHRVIAPVRHIIAAIKLNYCWS